VDCESHLCSGGSDGQKCSMQCGVGQRDVCPQGFECVATGASSTRVRAGRRRPTPVAATRAAPARRASCCSLHWCHGAACGVASACGTAHRNSRDRGARLRRRSRQLLLVDRAHGAPTARSKNRCRIIYLAEERSSHPGSRR
jgi:hypothetical protein